MNALGRTPCKPSEVCSGLCEPSDCCTDVETLPGTVCACGLSRSQVASSTVQGLSAWRDGSSVLTLLRSSLSKWVSCYPCVRVGACVCVHATSSPLGPFGPPPPRDIWQGLETFFVVLMGRGRENYYHLAGEAGDAAERLECIGWMVPHNRRCRCSSVCCAEAEPWCTDTVRTHVEYTE